MYEKNYVLTAGIPIEYTLEDVPYRQLKRRMYSRPGV